MEYCPNEIHAYIYGLLLIRDAVRLSVTCRLLYATIPPEISRVISIMTKYRPINASINNIDYFITTSYIEEIAIRIIANKLVIYRHYYGQTRNRICQGRFAREQVMVEDYGRRIIFGGTRFKQDKIEEYKFDYPTNLIYDIICKFAEVVLIKKLMRDRGIKSF